jgi:hypothetical protein
VPPTAISLISTKKCSKVISQTDKFVFIVISYHSKQKVVAKSVASTQSLYLQQKQVERIVEEYTDIFSSPTRVPTHCQVKHPIDLTHDVPFPNGLFYHRSLMENEEIKHHIQEIIQKAHIRSNSSPCGRPTILVQKKDGT